MCSHMLNGLSGVDSASADLLLVNLERVAVLHLELRVVSTVFHFLCTCSSVTHHLRVVRRVHSGAVEEEAHAGEGLALTLTEGVHELLELGGALNLEEDLVVVVGDLDVQVLGLLLGRLVLVASVGRGRRAGRHVGECL